MDPIISIKSGEIRGIRKTSQLGEEFYAFNGIPFARPPLGDLRFKAPVPVEPWEGVLEAIEEKPIPHCKKTHFKDPPTSEDCLYLNVYSKNIHAKKLPVIVYIFGGGFHSGSAATNLYGPDYLMHKDVVLVTFNYRLGVLGFLSLQDPALDIPGNAGLKDQRLALRWVNENISAFGGDAQNVTVIGQSAGSCSVHHHLLAPSSAGLFHRAILLSGSVFSCWGTCTAEAMGMRLAKKLGWNGEGGEMAAYEVLKNVDAVVLTDASASENMLTAEDRLKDVMHSFAPVIEPYESETSLCTKKPLELLENCWSKDLDVIFMYTSNESLYFFDGFIQIAQNKGIPNQVLVPYAARSSKDLDDAARKMKSIYGDFKDVGTKNYQQILDFFNDQIFLYGIHRGVSLRVTHHPGHTYFACFDLDSKTLNHAKIRHEAKDQPGVAHADELSYFFTNSFGPVPARNSVEFKNIQKMVNLVVGFATEGGQYCEKLSWNPVSKDELPYNYETFMIQESEWKMNAVPEMGRFKVWDEIHG